MTEDQDLDILVEGALAPDTEHLERPRRMRKRKESATAETLAEALVLVKPRDGVNAPDRLLA